MNVRFFTANIIKDTDKTTQVVDRNGQNFPSKSLFLYFTKSSFAFRYLFCALCRVLGLLSFNNEKNYLYKRKMTCNETRPHLFRMWSERHDHGLF